ncbi:MAG: rod shape-determining protein RodA [Alistipes sp.]|nr:rod shape-determining protein RodA [Alistipes sp.]
MNRLNQHSISFFSGVDPIAVMLYLLLVMVGFLNIFSASYQEDLPLLAFEQEYMKQFIWICISLTVAVVILLLDSKLYHMYAYYIYFGALLFLLMPFTPLGRAVNGARAWVAVGSISLQPAEFAKIATTLAVARLMSGYSFSLQNLKGLINVGILLFLPFAIIVLQNDMGSGLVMSSFLLVLYREGLNKWICIPLLMVIALFVCSFLFTPIFLVTVLFWTFVICSAMMTGQWQTQIRFGAVVCLVALVLYSVSFLLFDGLLSGYGALLISIALGFVVAVVYAWRKRFTSLFLMLMLFLGSMLFVPTADKIFSSMQPHQQQRMLSFLGLQPDHSHVVMSKTAIGSGGLFGKGFMDGTLIKNHYVSEHHTDFIFCTVSEEWGFVGVLVVMGLLCALIYRIIHIGERQEEAFGRIYCYGLAAVLLFHVLVNIGMTTGLMPVIGIPLPFLSYGGSSLLAFTIFVAIALRLDASPQNFSAYNR